MSISWFQQLKVYLVNVLALSKDALHMHLGLLVFIIAATFVRKRRGSLLPFGCAALTAVLLEVLDLRQNWTSLGELKWTASIHDVMNTLLWPAVLTLVWRRWKRPAEDG